MNAIASSAATRHPTDPAADPSAGSASTRRRGGGVRQVGAFAAIGVVSTLAYVALYALLRPLVSAETANAIALVTTAMGNTAANRRVTFAVRGRDGLARDHAAGLLALGAALVITSVSLAVLNIVVPDAPHAFEVAVLVVANAVATLVRFVLLRFALDRGRARDPRTAAHPGPVAAGRMLERILR
jgi:putative flippase GtrA